MLVLEKSPSSILPDHLSKTYAQYYQKEYGNILTNLTIFVIAQRLDTRVNKNIQF